MGTVLTASVAGALAAFAVEWLVKPRLELRADTLRARRDIFILIRGFLQSASTIKRDDLWELVPHERERRVTQLLEDARTIERLLPVSVRRGWVHWSWPRVASVVSRLAGLLQGMLLVPSESLADVADLLSTTADPLVERDATSRLLWRHRRALLEEARSSVLDRK